jgi:hypothetical protein
VAMVVVLLPISDEEPRIEQTALEKLAQLGVTSIALLRDLSCAGLVLEGWAFDPRDAPRAASAVAGVREGVRLLQPLAHLAIPSVDPRRDPSLERSER